MYDSPPPRSKFSSLHCTALGAGAGFVFGSILAIASTSGILSDSFKVPAFTSLFLGTSAGAIAGYGGYKLSRITHILTLDDNFEEVIEYPPYPDQISKVTLGESSRGSNSPSNYDQFRDDLDSNQLNFRDSPELAESEVRQSPEIRQSLEDLISRELPKAPSSPTPESKPYSNLEDFF